MRLARPTADEVKAHLAARRDLPFTRDDVGATRDDRAPSGYAQDHNRRRLGGGEATFVRARDAIRAWTMFPAPLAWIEPLPIPIEVGRQAGVVIRAPGV